jgi:hypothetical protein
MSHEIFEQAKAKLEEAKQAYRDAAKAFFAEFTKETFEALPDLKAIRWTQYTPYSNDGDSCEFSVSDPEYDISIAGDGRSSDPDDYDDDEKYRDLWDIGYDWKREDESRGTRFPGREVLEVFVRRFGGLGDDFFETGFGDHVQVTVTRDGETKVEEYSHD